MSVKNIIIASLVWAFIACFSINVFAQQQVITQPTKRTNFSTASTTIAITNTFQNVYPTNDSRLGCVIQNKSTSNVMYVYIGALADATIALSGKLAAGQAMYCTAFGTVLTGPVNVTGTSGDSFYASQY